MREASVKKPFLILNLEPFNFPLIVYENAITCSISFAGSNPIDTAAYDLVFTCRNYEQFQLNNKVHFNVTADVESLLSDYILLSKSYVDQVVILGCLKYANDSPVINLLKDLTIQLVPAFGVQPAFSDKILQLASKMKGLYTVESFKLFCFFEDHLLWLVILTALQILRPVYKVQIKGVHQDVFEFSETQMQNFIKLNQEYKLTLVNSWVSKKPAVQVIQPKAQLKVTRKDQLFFDLINQHGLLHSVEVRKINKGYSGSLSIFGDLLVSISSENTTNTKEECELQLFELGYQKLYNDPSFCSIPPFQRLENLLKKRNLDELVIEPITETVNQVSQINLKIVIGFTEFYSSFRFPTLEEAKRSLSLKVMSYLQRVGFEIESVDAIDLDNEFENELGAKRQERMKYASLLNGSLCLCRVLQFERYIVSGVPNH
eukprot:NODE_67_length_23829_cov_0.557059.p4 type:complete len:431 gc:universal NODE_67_length_23829_cov_0.557059:5849-4557(-)